ncbi:Nif3-like dinuclear metal center hexameric protein [Ihubacter sp. rT4E-8]|uniref:Nif3-like dinuclear metal center hexameric protein n=1 Tax=Ihubacter sp. rT4E-8 TaxID=3242369 RepID=UPI003CFB405A
MKKQRLIEKIEELCSSDMAESWDNCGFQINCSGEDVQTVLVSLEVTNQIIDEAIAEGADLILTHHPLLFQGIKKVDEEDVIGGYLFRLIKNDISVYSCHTSFDKMEGGNNDYLGQLLEFQNIRPFDRENRFCRKGESPFEITFAELMHRAAGALDMEEDAFRYVGDPSCTVTTVGWCTGAGSEFIRDAFEEGCDLYITGDVKYHEAQAAKEMGICILDLGHYGSERIFAENMARQLREACVDEKIDILESASSLNPFGL